MGPVKGGGGLGKGRQVAQGKTSPYDVKGSIHVHFNIVEVGKEFLIPSMWETPWPLYPHAIYIDIHYDASVLYAVFKITKGCA